LGRTRASYAYWFWRAGFAAAAIQILLFIAAGATPVYAGTGLHDPAFSQVPFDQWRLDGNQSLIPWSVEVLPPELSSHQRLLVAVKIQVDGRKLTKHHLKDHLVALVQFEEADGTVWQTHSSLTREPGGEFNFTQNAFVLPGDYVLSVAVSDSTGLQHSFFLKKLQVPPLKHETLDHLWDGLPRVDFLAAHPDSPDGWFLPEIESRLRLPVQTQHTVHIDLLLNTTPGEYRPSDPVAGLRRNMSFLIPALKVISQLELRNGTMDVAFLDLARQQAVSVANWGEMKGFFSRTNPGIIDVKALDGQWTMRNFFLKQIAQRMETPREAEHVVIVLSGPAFFDGQEPAVPIALRQYPALRVFYIRCREIPRSMLEPRPRPRPGARPIPRLRAAFALPLDDLELPLNTPGVRIYDVLSAEQFRRVLAAVIGQISQL
jgi:hypothetical protein